MMMMTSIIFCDNIFRILKGAESQGQFCAKLNHYFEALIINKMLL